MDCGRCTGASGRIMRRPISSPSRRAEFDSRRAARDVPDRRAMIASPVIREPLPHFRFAGAGIVSLFAVPDDGPRPSGANRIGVTKSGAHRLARQFEATWRGNAGGGIGSTSRLPPSSAPRPRLATGGTFGSGLFDAIAALPRARWAGPVETGSGPDVERVPPLDHVRDDADRDWRAMLRERLAAKRPQALLSRNVATAPAVETDFGPLRRSGSPQVKRCSLPVLPAWRQDMRRIPASSRWRAGPGRPGGTPSARWTCRAARWPSARTSPTAAVPRQGRNWHTTAAPPLRARSGPASAG